MARCELDRFGFLEQVLTGLPYAMIFIHEARFARDIRFSAPIQPFSSSQPKYCVGNSAPDIKEPMEPITIVALLGGASTFTMFAALVRQTMRAERAERRLELAYGLARAMKGERFADALRDGPTLLSDTMFERAYGYPREGAK